MIFNNIKYISSNKKYDIKHLYNIQEDVVRMVTKMNFLNNDDISTLEVEDYIDNLIIYFKNRLNIIEEINNSKHIQFNKYKKSLSHIISGNNDIKININVNVPNKSFYKIPSFTLINLLSNDITIEKFINESQSTQLIFDIDSSYYTKYVRTITCNLANKNKFISGDAFISSISSNENIYDRKVLIEYINKLQYPTTAIQLFRDLYYTIEYQLKDIKSTIRENYSKHDMSKCMKAVTNISSFYKNIFTIVLNVYKVQMSILNINNKPLSESIIDKITNNNINYILQESECIVKCDFNKAIDISNNNMNEYKNIIIPNIKSYVQNLYESTMMRIEKSNRFIPHSFDIDFDLYKQNLYRNISEINNSDEYISNIYDISKDYSDCEYITEGRYKEICIEIDNIKDNVMSILKSDFDTIITYIDKLITEIPDDLNISSIYERPFNKLGVYSDDIYNYYKEVLSPLSHINSVSELLYNRNSNQDNVIGIIKDLENHFKNDYNSFVKYKSYVMELYNFYNTSLNDISQNDFKYRNYYMDSRLLAYLSYFENKVGLI